MDWKTLILLGMQIMTLIFVLGMKLNELKHLVEDVNENRRVLNQLRDEISDLNQRVSRIEGRLNSK